jgi:hypothetical protein
MGGVQSSVVTQNNLAPFSLPASASSSTPQKGGAGSVNASFTTGGINVLTTQETIGITTNVAVQSGGQNVPLPTLPPALIVNYQIKY